MKCLLYARVSTEDQADLSIPAQLQAMREFAARHGWTVVGEFIEPGVSGRSVEHRQALQALLARCQVSPKVDIVLVHKIDRLARNVFDHVNIRVTLQQQHIRLASVVENIDDSISGQLLENIMASIAQFYSSNLGEEVKKGMKMLVQRGGWPHKPPRGYRLERSADGRSSVVVDEPLAAGIRAAFEQYAGGWTSMWQLSKDLAAKGILTVKGQILPLGTMYNMLKNPFYAGRVVWKGTEYQGRHQALVSRALFNRVQQVLRAHHTNPPERGRHQFLMRKVAVCAQCASRMTAEHHLRGSYYRCSRNTRSRKLCRARFSNVSRAHESLSQLYAQLRIPDSFRQRLRDGVEQLLSAKADKRTGLDRRLSLQKAKLEEREVRLTEAFAEGVVSMEAYRRSTEGLRAKLQAIEAQRSKLRQDPRLVRETVLHALEGCSSLLDLEHDLDLARRQKLLRILFERIVLDQGAITSYRLRPPFDRLFHAGSSGSRSSFDVTEVTSTIESILEHADVLNELTLLKVAA
jgi:DNA invertase Pin-like site-specific DNA recombinase